jgi:hypothetical protein
MPAFRKKGNAQFSRGGKAGSAKIFSYLSNCQLAHQPASRVSRHTVELRPGSSCYQRHISATHDVEYDYTLLTRQRQWQMQLAKDQSTALQSRHGAESKRWRNEWKHNPIQ